MVAMAKKERGKLVAVRKDSPLVVGIGQNEYFLASDIPATLAYTRDNYIINDDEVGVVVTDISGNRVEKEIFHVKWDAVAAEKGGYPHFMLKEIYEQPKAIRETLSGRVSADDKEIILNELSITADEIKSLRNIFIVACGTAFHAGMVGKYVIEDLARISVTVDIASEFRYRNPIINKGDLVIVISQSGETADTLAALRASQKAGAKVLAVTNVVSSGPAPKLRWLLLRLIQHSWSLCFCWASILPRFAGLLMQSILQGLSMACGNCRIRCRQS